MARLGGLGRARRTRHLNADVNIINLVDVMLVLLIIFMVTAPILQGGIQVRLPKAIAKPLDTPEALTITVGKTGEISVGDKNVTLQQFKSMFQALVSTKRPSSVNVRADAGVRWDTIAQVLGIVHAAGIEKVGLPVEPIPNQ